MGNGKSKRRQTEISVDKAVLAGLLITLGLICLMAALFPIILILFVFVGIEWILKHARPK